MGLEVKMDLAELRNSLQREVQRSQARVISLLEYVGQEVVNKIRTSAISNWIDQTGNLRSSIGYIITLDGQPVSRGKFPAVRGPERTKETADGSSIGIHYALSLASLFPKGIALIIVAGMEYASYVEKRDNKTVLAQGEIEAQKLISKMLAELNAKTSGK